LDVRCDPCFSRQGADIRRQYDQEGQRLDSLERATVDDVVRSGHHPRPIGRQEKHHIRDFLWLNKAPPR